MSTFPFYEEDSAFLFTEGPEFFEPDDSGLHLVERRVVEKRLDTNFTVKDDKEYFHQDHLYNFTEIGHNIYTAKKEKTFSATLDIIENFEKRTIDTTLLNGISYQHLKFDHDIFYLENRRPNTISTTSLHRCKVIENVVINDEVIFDDLGLGYSFAGGHFCDYLIDYNSLASSNGGYTLNIYSPSETTTDVNTCRFVRTSQDVFLIKTVGNDDLSFVTSLKTGKRYMFRCCFSEAFVDENYLVLRIAHHGYVLIFDVKTMKPIISLDKLTKAIFYENRTLYILSEEDREFILSKYHLINVDEIKQILDVTREAITELYREDLSDESKRQLATISQHHQHILSRL